MYIRTKDGRIIDTEKEYEPLEWAKQARDYALTIAQSDNLAELCDEFVYNNQILSKEDRYNEEYLSQLYCFNDIYGAIWTDKGLIYVAKMNEDGKLELL